MNETTKQIMQDIQKYKGREFVVLCAVEEMAELSKELLKDLNRGRGNIDNITEELADVIICLQHVKDVYNTNDDNLYNIINEKMPRVWGPKIKEWKENS